MLCIGTGHEISPYRYYPKWHRILVFGFCVVSFISCASRHLVIFMAWGHRLEGSRCIMGYQDSSRLFEITVCQCGVVLLSSLSFLEFGRYISRVLSLARRLSCQSSFFPPSYTFSSTYRSSWSHFDNFLHSFVPSLGSIKPLIKACEAASAGCGLKIEPWCGA